MHPHAIYVCCTCIQPYTHACVTQMAVLRGIQNLFTAPAPSRTTCPAPTPSRPSPPPAATHGRTPSHTRLSQTPPQSAPEAPVADTAQRPSRTPRQSPSPTARSSADSCAEAGVYQGARACASPSPEPCFIEDLHALLLLRLGDTSRRFKTISERDSNANRPFEARATPRGQRAAAGAWAGEAARDCAGTML